MRHAIIGYGEVAQKHYKAIQEIGGELVAVCEPQQKDIPCSRIYTNTDDFWQNLYNIDVISICTPNFYHPSMAIKALEAGRLVILEKPVAANIEDAQTLASHPLVDHVAVCYQRRWNTQCVKMKELFDKVKPEFVSARIEVRRDPPYWQGWRSDKSLSGGGSLMNIDIHYLDLLQWWLGRDYTVDFARIAESNGVDQAVSAVLSFSNTEVGLSMSSLEPDRNMSILAVMPNFPEENIMPEYKYDDATHTNVYRDFLENDKKVGVEEAMVSLQMVEDIYRKAKEFTWQK